MSAPAEVAASPWPVLAAGVVALVAIPSSARLARELGWVDRREGAEARKPRLGPVPLVGGPGLVLALAAGSLAGGPSLPWLALLAAFALGVVDDLAPRGLGPGRKLAGQVGVALLLALDPGGIAWADGALERVALALLAVVAMNAVNTFDNADGAAGVLGALALWSLGPARAALLVFLPFNLVVRRSVRGERLPVAMLGDSGAHVIGVLIAATPGAALLLVLPLLDLARLVLVRRARGQAPWTGDRRHLAHRLEALGYGPLAVAAVLAALLLPGWLAGLLFDLPALRAVGALTTAAAFFAVLSLTPDPDRVAGADGRPDTGRLA